MRPIGRDSGGRRAGSRAASPTPSGRDGPRTARPTFLNQFGVILFFIDQLREEPLDFREFRAVRREHRFIERRIFEHFFADFKFIGFTLEIYQIGQTRINRRNGRAAFVERIAYETQNHESVISVDTSS